MALPLLNWLYRKLGRHYPAVFLTAELLSAFVIVAATLWLFTFFYDASTDAFLKTLVVVEGLTVFGVGITLYRTYPRLRPITEWMAASTTRSTPRAPGRRPSACRWR